MPTVDELRKSNFDKKAVSQLDYRKKQREQQMKESELRRKKMDLDQISREVEFKKKRQQEIHYVLRRVEAERTRAEGIFNRESQEDEAVAKNLEKEKHEQKEEAGVTDGELKKIGEEIEKMKAEIKERELKLQELEKKDQELERQKDKTKRGKGGIISRLIKILQREKIETIRVKQRLDDLTAKREALKRENANLKADITILSNKFKALERNMK